MSCKLVGAERHPARFPAALPQHFIRMCSDPGDVVLDIFGGSNVTGQVAEAEGRRWLAFDLSREYLAASAFRFLPRTTSPAVVRHIYAQVTAGQGVHIPDAVPQAALLDLRAAE